MKTEYKKRYYSIKEVSVMTGLESYVLRYWESVFPKLKPQKHNVNKRRMYTQKDIEIVNRIKDLLYDKKYTIKGANEVLNSRHEIVQLDLDFEKNFQNENKKEQIKRLILDTIKILRGEN